jgi:CheY-like chemotaxis protein
MQPAANTTVLVIEDEILVRLDLSEALESRGYFVRHAGSADEALHILERDRTIGVVFTDIKMDGSMDGIELAHVIKDQWPDIVIVYSSGNIPETRPLGPTGVKLLPKPYDPGRLKSVLQEVAQELRHDM